MVYFGISQLFIFYMAVTALGANPLQQATLPDDIEVWVLVVIIILREIVPRWLENRKEKQEREADKEEKLQTKMLTYLDQSVTLQHTNQQKQSGLFWQAMDSYTKRLADVEAELKLIKGKQGDVLSEVKSFGVTLRRAVQGGTTTQERLLDRLEGRDDNEQ